MQVPDTIIVKAAAQKAVLANAKGALRSRSMHAELVFNLSGSKHVGGLSLAVASSVFDVLILRSAHTLNGCCCPTLQLSCFIRMLWSVRGDMTRSRSESH